MKPLSTVVREALKNAGYIDRNATKVRCYVDKNIISNKVKIRVMGCEVDADAVKSAIAEIDPKRAASIIDVYTIEDFSQYVVIHFGINEKMQQKRRLEKAHREGRSEGRRLGYDSGFANGQNAMRDALVEVFGDQFEVALQRAQKKQQDEQQELNDKQHELNSKKNKTSKLLAMLEL